MKLCFATTWIMICLAAICVPCQILAAANDSSVADNESLVDDVALQIAGTLATDLPKLLDSIVNSVFQTLCVRGVGGGMIDEVEEIVLEIADEGEMNVDNALKNWNPVLAAELGFVRLVCEDLMAEQRVVVRAAAETRLRQYAREPVDLSKQDAISSVRDAISTCLKQVLTQERYERFEALANDRMSHRKQSAILSAVARIDSVLLLSSDQREELMRVIASDWEPYWERWCKIPDLQDHVLPMIPDHLVTCLLDESQLLIWNESPKFFSSCDIHDLEAIELMNDGWWGESSSGLTGVGFEESDRPLSDGP